MAAPRVTVPKHLAVQIFEVIVVIAVLVRLNILRARGPVFDESFDKPLFTKRMHHSAAWATLAKLASDCLAKLAFEDKLRQARHLTEAL